MIHSRSLNRSLACALSMALITIILVTQTPALPASARQLYSESRDSFKFWFHSSGWSKTVSLLTGQLGGESAAQAEKQADRDARVATIRAFPGDVSLKMGERVFFTAAGYDEKGQAVGGIKFTWAAREMEGLRVVRMSQTGEFVPSAPGHYIVTVEGAQKTARLSITVIEDKDRPTKNTKPLSVREVSSRDQVSSAPQLKNQPEPNVEEEPEGGWNESNFPAADDPENDRGNPPGRPLHHDAGSGNFQIHAPIISLPGRGVDVSLALTYNSRMWTKSNSDITYDIDRDWPAAGWSLGFGRVAGLGVGGAMLIDADGTRHGFSGTVTQFPSGFIGFEGHTVDGTFIDYSTFTDSTGVINFAQVKMPNGTVIQYGAPGRGAVHPQRITDANGNYITVEYRFNPERGPKIQRVTDTLGRVMNFYYEAGKLTAITAPGLDGSEHPLVRLHYKTLTLNYGFSSTLTANVDNPTPDVLDAIYYPGTGTGYWFGDSDSYSSYGMLAKYSEQRAMGFSAASLDVQGTVTPGTITKQCAYNYTLTPNNTLTDAPTYTTQTETWDGMDTGPAVTQFLLQHNGTTRSATVTLPDLTKSVQLSHRAPGQFNDGYIYEDSTYAPGDVLMRKSTVTWAMGDYSSARPVRIEATDERNQTTATEFSYGSFNQVTDVRDFDYGGVNRLRTTRVAYRNNIEYTNRHIFNLIRRVDVWDATDTIRMSRVLYDHDQTLVANTPGVTHHDPTYDPYQPPECFWDPELGQEICVPVYNSANDFRGNVTTVTRFSNAAGATGAITETRSYDMTGNMVSAATSCCQQTSLAYSLNTQFAHPESQTQGSADPQSPARITISAIYNFSTGLLRFATDANGRQSQTTYLADTLRPQTLTSSTGGSTSYTYDDTAMSLTQTINLLGGAVASQNVKWLNGLGQVSREEA
ncbi:MAG TPA: hypothetical protein VFB82_02760, partial [Blastocatellia bacterium]|nr:hypothetical protein [Blastocatellia bacterium]